MIKNKNIVIWAIVLVAFAFLLGNLGLFAINSNLSSGKFVVFRTTDLSYGSASSIAFSDTCGGALVPYTYKTCAGCNGLGFPGSCFNGKTGYTKITDLPGKINVWGGNAVALYSGPNNVLYLCGSSSSNYIYIALAPGGIVDTRNNVVVDASKEKTCFDVNKCVEDWQCTSWSECSPSNTKTRTCVDTNSCGTLKNKQAESMTCSCQSTWSNGEWSVCTGGMQYRTIKDTTCGAADKIESRSCNSPTCVYSIGEWTSCANSTQTRTVTDNGNCVNQQKPITSQSCGSPPPEPKTNWVLWTILGIGAVIVVVFATGGKR